MIVILLLLIAILAIIGCIKIKKSTLRVLLGGIAIITLLLAFLLESFIYIIHYRINPVDTSTSPDGTYELLFQQVGDPDFPFGYTHARLVLKTGNKTVTKRSFDIADDGASASENNWDVNWKDTSVEVLICGDEQYDHLYILNFDGTDDSKQLDTHYGRTEEERRQVSAGTFVESPVNATEECVSIPTDSDGYPLTDEYQAYKKEMKAIAKFVDPNEDSAIQYYFTAKGYPYSVISSVTENDGQIIKKELILNENYLDETKHEYVLEELSLDSNGNETDSPEILDFYLIDCQTLQITDEQTNRWH